MSKNTKPEANDLKELSSQVDDMPVTAPMGVAAIALQMAMRYYDINTVQDGALYQQYKLEGRNLPPLHLDMVFETALRIEEHLLNSENRISQMLVDTVSSVIDQVIDEAAAETVGGDGEQEPEP